MYLGVDLGTSSVKLLLADSKGNILDSASADYPLFFPKKTNRNEWRSTCCSWLELR